MQSLTLQIETKPFDVPAGKTLGMSIGGRKLGVQALEGDLQVFVTKQGILVRAAAPKDPV